MLAPTPTEDTSQWLRVLRLESHEPGYVPTAYMEQERYSQSIVLPTSGSSRESNSTMINTPSHQNSAASNSSRSPHFRPARKIKQPNSPYTRLTGVSRDTDL